VTKGGRVTSLIVLKGGKRRLRTGVTQKKRSSGAHQKKSVHLPGAGLASTEPRVKEKGTLVSIGKKESIDGGVKGIKQGNTRLLEGKKKVLKKSVAVCGVKKHGWFGVSREIRETRTILIFHKGMAQKVKKEK